MDPGTRHLSRRTSVRLTRRGLGALLFGGLALILAYPMGRSEYLAIAGAALLAPIAALVFVRIRRPRFEVTRHFSPPVVAAGAVARVALHVRNRSVLPSTPLAWNEALPWPDPATPHELGGIPATSSVGRVRALSYDIRPPRRGLYAIGPFVVQFEDPFGMVSSTLAIGRPDQLVVIPAISSLPEGGPTLIDGDGAAQLVQRRVAGNDDDLSTREYRTGDALRRVHWRASARHGDLMVRQEEHRSHPDARIIVDTRLRGYPDAVRDRGRSWSAQFSSEAFEWVMRMTGSLGLHLESAGFRVSVDETARRQIEPMGERWEGRRAEDFLTSLAAVELLDRKAGALEDLPATESAGPVFAVLADPEDDTVSWLLNRKRGVDAGFAFLVEAREDVRRRLVDHGWFVVDVDPDTEPGDVWRTAATEAEYRRGAR